MSKILILPVLVLGLGIAIVKAAREGFKEGFEKKPEPAPKETEDFLNEVENKAKSHSLTLIHYQDDGRVWANLWADGIMVYNDRREDEPYADYQARLDAEVQKWETTTGVKCLITNYAPPKNPE